MFFGICSSIKGKVFTNIRKEIMIVFKYMQCFQFACIFLAFLFSLKTIKSDKVIGYMRGFYWYSFVAITSAIVGIIVLLTQGAISNFYFIVNKLSFIFHFIFLGFFIGKVIKNPRLKVKFTFLFYVFLLLLLYFLVTTLLNPKSYIVTAVANSSLVVFCLLYYYDLFEGISVPNFITESSFWVVSGVFACLTITVPLNAVRSFFDREANDEINLYLGALTTFSYSIMHLCFAKAYICSVRYKNECGRLSEF